MAARSVARARRHSTSHSFFTVRSHHVGVIMLTGSLPGGLHRPGLWSGPAARAPSPHPRSDGSEQART
eukprot:4361870-Prymnesium_polylepis.1